MKSTIFLFTLAFAVVPLGLRARESNGEDWQIFADAMRTVYVKGVYDASFEIFARDTYRKLRASTNKLDGSFEEELGAANRYVPRASTVTIRDVMEALTRFYAVPENRPISILNAMEIVAAGFNGASSACVNEQTLFFRMMTARVKDGTEQMKKVFQVCTPDQTSIGSSSRGQDAKSEDH